MRRYYRAAVLLMLLLAAGLIAVVKLTAAHNDTAGSEDVLFLNEIAHKAAEGDIPTESGSQTREFVILDSNGSTLFDNRRDRSEKLTAETAVRNRLPYTYIIRNGKITGSVILADAEKLSDMIRGRIIAAYIGCSLLLISAVLAFGAYVRRTIILPFNRMKDFAAFVAAGDLDKPLEMDRDNMFGAFSESFDIMREELKASRSRELELQKKERELVASLSHDIKTPVTGIKLTSELMAAVFSGSEGHELTITPDMTAKMNNIGKRADEINALISDLFSSTLEDIGEFKVELNDENSAVIAEIIEKYDDRGLVRAADIPKVIIHTDRIRLSQVIGNIIYNSYKYADTPIDISFRLTDGFLETAVSDSGPGVDEDEIELITNKFYRGKAQSGKEGSGLGLYIAKMLMEKMGGGLDISSRNGLCVRILIPLS